MGLVAREGLYSFYIVAVSAVRLCFVSVRETMTDCSMPLSPALNMILLLREGRGEEEY